MLKYRMLIATALFFCQLTLLKSQTNSIYFYCKAATLEQQSPDSALIYLDLAIKENNTATYSYARKAAILLSKKKNEDAISVYKYLENSDMPLSKLGLARCKAAQNEASAALAELDAYFKVGIPLPENKIRFDEYLVQISDSASWINFWKKEHYTPNQLLAKECVFMLKTGQRDEAIDLLNKKLKKSKTPELYHARAYIYKDMALYEAAISDYSKAVKADSRNILWLSEYAEVLYNAEKYEESIRIIKQALNQEPALFSLYLLRAKSLNATKKHEDAVADLDFYLSFFPSDASVWKLKSEIYTDANLLLPALVAVNKAIALKPDNCTWRYNRSDLFTKTEVYQRALLDLDEVIDCQPNNAEAWFKRGELNNKLGKKEAACSDWKQAASLGYLEAFKRTEHSCFKQ